VTISQALAGITSLGIETAPFIYFVERNQTYLDRIRAVFTLVTSEKVQVITSAITLTEVLVLPFQTGSTTYVSGYRDMLLNSKNISTVPVSAVIAEKAAELRATYRLRTPDALHVATAIISGCDAFLTNDLGL
jgi:predicted nucleic acid-binding protein